MFSDYSSRDVQEMNEMQEAELDGDAERGLLYAGAFSVTLTL